MVRCILNVSCDENVRCRTAATRETAETGGVLSSRGEVRLQNRDVDCGFGFVLHGRTQLSTNEAMSSASAPSAIAAAIIPSHLSARGTGYNTAHLKTCYRHVCRCTVAEIRTEYKGTRRKYSVTPRSRLMTVD